jgi:hypothetical protein
MPTLDDGVAAAEVPWLFQGFADRAEKMAAFTPTQWEVTRTAFMVSVIDVAVGHARLVQPSPVPPYWQKVLDASEEVKAALKSGDKKQLAAAARRAAAARALVRAQSFVWQLVELRPARPVVLVLFKRLAPL